MPVSDGSASFDVVENTLHVGGELGHEESEGFERAIRELIDTGHTSLVIDLLRVRHMGSSTVRHIAIALIEAKQAGRQITIRAGKRVLRLLGFAGIDKLGTMELVDE